MNTCGTHFQNHAAHILKKSPYVIEKIGAGSRDRTGILSLEVSRISAQPIDIAKTCAGVPCVFTHWEVNDLHDRRHKLALFTPPQTGVSPRHTERKSHD